MAEEKRVLLEYADKINPEKAEEYIKVGGYTGLEKARKMETNDLIQEVKNSGLRGRGGSRLQCWYEVELCTQARRDQICCLQPG